MRAGIVYSSCTGNTRLLAETLAQCTGIPCFAVRQAPAPDRFDLLALGFWVRRGQPDSRSQRYMALLRGKAVFCFGTLGAWPHSSHARHSAEAARALLEQGGNTVLDIFLCQGRVDPRVIAATTRKGTHPPTPERLERLREAARHPDNADCMAVLRHWRGSLVRLASADIV